MQIIRANYYQSNIIFMSTARLIKLLEYYFSRTGLIAVAASNN